MALVGPHLPSDSHVTMLMAITDGATVFTIPTREANMPVRGIVLLWKTMATRFSRTSPKMLPLTRLPGFRRGSFNAENDGICVLVRDAAHPACIQRH
jgi:hypothetical protein